MADYTKIELPVAVGARLLGHPALAFSGKFDRASGAVYSDQPAIAEYGPTLASGRTTGPSDPRRALQFIVYASGRTILHGSFHKYAQGGANWGDYTFTQFVATVAELCRTFDLDPRTMRLLLLEVGLNCIPPMASPETLKQFVCSGPGIPLEPHKWFERTVYARKAERTEYEVKIYDKGRQYGRPGRLLRFEVKFTKAIQLQRLGIFTMNDLLNPDAWHRLRVRVMAIYDELFIAEPSIDLPSLTESQRTFVALVRTPDYWQDLTKGARFKARARYADIVQRFAASNLKDELRSILDAKLNDLLIVPSQAHPKGDGFTNIPAGDIGIKREPFHGSVNVGTGYPVDAGNSYAVELVNTAPETIAVRRCLTCGRDITDQREGSRYCSEARFNNAGKRCRNAGSNPRNNRLRSIARIERDPLLFDHRPFIASPQP